MRTSAATPRFGTQFTCFTGTKVQILTRVCGGHPYGATCCIKKKLAVQRLYMCPRTTIYASSFYYYYYYYYYYTRYTPVSIPYAATIYVSSYYYMCPHSPTTTTTTDTRTRYTPASLPHARTHTHARARTHTHTHTRYTPASLPYGDACCINLRCSA